MQKTVKTKRRKVDKKILETICECLEKWWTIWDACYLAGIQRSSFYYHYNQNEKFAMQVDFARSKIERKSRELLWEAITDKKDTNMAKWYLERKAKDEFSTKTEHTSKSDVNISLDNILQEIINNQTNLIKKENPHGSPCGEKD